LFVYMSVCDWLTQEEGEDGDKPKIEDLDEEDKDKETSNHKTKKKIKEKYTEVKSVCLFVYTAVSVTLWCLSVCLSVCLPACMSTLQSLCQKN